MQDTGLSQQGHLNFVVLYLMRLLASRGSILRMTEEKLGCLHRHINK
jgi:hypothetical protein